MGEGSHEKGISGYLTKTEFKCAYIYVFGIKPSKDDILVCKHFIKETTKYPGDVQSVPFELSKESFITLMKAFSEVIDIPSGGPLASFLHKKTAPIPKPVEKMNQA